MKRAIKIICILLIVFFLSIYFSSYSNFYYENNNVLKEEDIKRFEKDLKMGRSIDINNYIEKDKNYNNKICLISLRISKYIDSFNNKILKYILKYLNS